MVPLLAPDLLSSGEVLVYEDRKTKIKKSVRARFFNDPDQIDYSQNSRCEIAEAA